MQTPAHLIIGAALFARPNAPRVTTAALIGSFLPDLSLYAMVFWSINVQNISPQVVFDQLYFSDRWMSVFAIDNSFILWGATLALALWWRNWIAIVLTASAFVHLALDFPLHHDDGRPHFWPLSDWVFESPVSYWDPHAHGGIISLLEAGLCAVLLVMLWRRFPGWFARGLILCAVVAQVMPAVVFGVMF